MRLKILKIIFTLILWAIAMSLLYFIPFKGAIALGVFLAFWASNIENETK